MKIGDVFFEKHTVIKMSSRDPEQWAEADVEEVNAIEIPDNATNGDIAKKFLPYDSYEFTEHCVWCYTGNFLNTRFDLDWWNAPYKKGENNGS